MDTYSEQWRFECEVRAVLAMPTQLRRGFLDLVEKRRGRQARQELEAAVFKTWIERQVDELAAMPRDDQRMARLLRIQNASNVRTRTQVENALNGRLAANDNQGELYGPEAASN